MDNTKERLAALWDEAKETARHGKATRVEELLKVIEPLIEGTDADFAFDRAELLRYRARVHFIRGEYSDGIRVGEQALDAFRTLDDNLGQARCIMMIGNCHCHAGALQTSIKFHQQAVELFETVGDDSDRGWGFCNLGVSYVDLGDYKHAVAAFERAQEFFTAAEDTKSLSHVLSISAAPYFYMGDYSTAMKISLKAYHAAKKVGMLDSAQGAASNISFLALQAGALDVAQSWVRVAKEMSDTLELTINDVNSMLNHEMIELKLDLSIDALHAFEQRLLDLYDAGHHIETVSSSPFVAKSYFELGDRESARRVAELWVNRSAEMEFRPDVLTLRRIQLGISAFDHHNDELVAEGERILREVEESKQSEEIEETLKILAELHRDRGEFEQSTEYYQRYITVRAENAERRSRHTTEMAQIQFDHERLDQLSEKQQELLSSVMPDTIVERLMSGEEDIADAHDEASVMFLDLVSFTTLSSHVPPAHLIHLLNAVFSACDAIVNEYGLTKIKTIGDSYLAVSGLPHAQEDHAQRMASASLDLIERLKDLQVTMPPELGDTSWVDAVDDLSIRIGLHCGPVVAGVIGKQRAQYDVWGDTVNVASRMESSGDPDRIHISEDFAMKIGQGASPEFEGTDVVIKQGPFQMRMRGTQKIKGKGDMKTFWLEKG